MSQERRHATAIAIAGEAVLIEGPSGSGKSDLALRLIDQGALLVGDDQVMVSRDKDGLWVQPMPTIEGRMEVRGLGIIAVPSTARAPLRLVVKTGQPAERMPATDQGLPRSAILDVGLPTLEIIAFEASAPAKIRLALMAHSRELFRGEITPRE